MSNNQEFIRRLGFVGDNSIDCDSITCRGSTIVGNDLDVENQIVSNSLVLDNNTSAPDNGVPDTGLVWVNDNSPNQLVFTDDAGTDHILVGSGAGFIPTIGSSVDNSIATWDGVNGDNLQDTSVTIDGSGGLQATSLSANSTSAGELLFNNLYSAYIFSDIAQIIPNNSDIILTFDTERFDTSPMGNMADLANNRIVIQLDGYYEIKGHIYWDSPNQGTDSRYEVRLIRNTIILAQQTFSTVGTTNAGSTVSYFDFFNSGDLITVRAFQTSGVLQGTGANSNINPALQNWLSVSYRGG